MGLLAARLHPVCRYAAVRCDAAGAASEVASAADQACGQQPDGAQRVVEARVVGVAEVQAQAVGEAMVGREHVPRREADVLRQGQSMQLETIDHVAQRDLPAQCRVANRTVGIQSLQ